METGISKKEGAGDQPKSSQDQIGEGVRKSLKDIIGDTTVDDYLNSMVAISVDDAEFFIRHRHGHILSNYIEKIPEGDREKVASLLIANNVVYSLAKNLSKIKMSDSKVLLDLLYKLDTFCDNGGSLNKAKEIMGYILDNVQSYPALIEKIIDIISSSRIYVGDLVLMKMDHIPAVYHQRIMENSFKMNPTLGVEERLADMSGAKGLNKEIAMQFIKEIIAVTSSPTESDSYLWNMFIKKINSFSGLDSEVAAELVNAGLWREVLKNMQCFEGLDKNVALMILKQGDYDGTDYQKLFLFNGLDTEVLVKIIHSGKYDDSELMANSHRFNSVNLNELKRAMKDNYYFSEKVIDKFKADKKGNR